MSRMLIRVRQWGRLQYDSFYCKDWHDIQKIGDINSWHVKVSGLKRNSIIYSAGVGHDISFEKQLAERFQVRIELFDPSPTGIQTMQRVENQLPKINFHPVGLVGAKMRGVKFAQPADPREGSFRLAGKVEDVVEFECLDLASLMADRGHNRIDLLKMDIEGFEYGVIEDIVENSLDVRQICVEFHHFFEHIPRKTTMQAIGELKRAGYGLIYKTRYDHTFLRSDWRE